MLTPVGVAAETPLDSVCNSPVVDKIPNPVCPVNDAVNGAIETVGTVVDFASDPFGYLGDKLAEACRGLVDTVIPVMIRAAQPDLSADFFVNAYKISWGLSFFLLVFVLFSNFLALGRGKASTADVAETLTIYLPAWALGVVAGPALGQLLIELVWGLVADLWKWPGFGAGTNLKGTGEKLGEYVAGGPSEYIPGGDIVYIVVLSFMLLALLAVIVVMLVMSVTLYFSGALLPLTLIWVMKPGSRSKGLKVLYIWVGILFAIPLMFFGLGLAFSMVNAGFQLTGAVPDAKDLEALTDEEKVALGVRNLISLLLAVVVIAMVALAPWKLSKMLGDAAPDDGGGADKPSSADASSDSGGSRTAQLSQQQANAGGSSAPSGQAKSPATAGAQSDPGSSRMEAGQTGSSGGKTGTSAGGAGQSAGAAGGKAAGAGTASKAASATPAGMPIQVAQAAAKVGKAGAAAAQQAGSQTAQMSQRSAAEGAARSDIDRKG